MARENWKSEHYTMVNDFTGPYGDVVNMNDVTYIEIENWEVYVPYSTPDYAHAYMSYIHHVSQFAFLNLSQCASPVLTYAIYIFVA